MYTFQHFQQLRASVDELYPFFADIANLEESTPNFFHLELRDGEPGGRLQVGQLFHYKFRLFGIPFPWTTEITRVEKDTFVDVQRRGPYQTFEHIHAFHATSEGTLMTDTVRYRLLFGPLSPVANALVVRPLLEAIFAFRARRAAERFGEIAP